MAAVERPRIVPAPEPADPHISIVIPIYNEQAILHAAVVDLRERLKPLGWSYEIILAENGSKDRTIQIGNELAAKYTNPLDGQRSQRAARRRHLLAILQTACMALQPKAGAGGWTSNATIGEVHPEDERDMGLSYPPTPVFHEKGH